jgi:hypothetical protein
MSWPTDWAMDRSMDRSIDRRQFLKVAGAGLSTVGLACWGSSGAWADGPPPPPQLIVVETDARHAALNYLSWDTEAGQKTAINLLRSPVIIRVRLGGQTYSTANLQAIRKVSENRVRFRVSLVPGCELVWTITECPASLAMTLSATGSRVGEIEAVEMVFPWSPSVTPTSILPREWTGDGRALMPFVFTAPDFGQIVVHSSIAEARVRLEGSRAEIKADLVLELPAIASGQTYEINFAPLYLPAPEGLTDVALWKSVRRAWFNGWQPSARWGDQTTFHSSPGGVLANNVISDPVSFSLVFYSDQAFWTPFLTPEISVMDSVRPTLEWWLNSRTLPSGQVLGYWDYSTFLDANPSILISAWDYVESTNDLGWLEARANQLERVAECLAQCDVDGDGLLEATQSGNDGTLLEPQRSSNWYDAINFGYKDGYSNALIYRAWRCMADLQRRLGHDVSERRYRGLANHLKAAYRDALFNPATGWLACWKDEDGELHDYASPVVNGIAIEYGLVQEGEGRVILGRIWDKISEVGFSRLDLGIPSVLIPIKADDYIQPYGFGSPQTPDGTDTFQQYENGGITAGQTIHFLAAHYVVGVPNRADTVLRAMIHRQNSVGFQNGVRDNFPLGMDWTTWDGSSCGYEGFLADVFVFLQAVLLREPAFRDRYYRPLLV